MAKGPHKLFLVCQYSMHEDIELLRGMLITYCCCMFVMHGLTCAQLYEIGFWFEFEPYFEGAPVVVTRTPMYVFIVIYLMLFSMVSNQLKAICIMKDQFVCFVLQWVPGSSPEKLKWISRQILEKFNFWLSSFYL